MTALAHSLKVIVAALLDFTTGEMGDGQNDNRLRVGVFATVLRLTPLSVVQAAFSRAFASTAAPTEADASADLGPVFRVSRSIFRTDWHRTSIYAYPVVAHSYQP